MPARRGGRQREEIFGAPHPSTPNCRPPPLEASPTGTSALTEMFKSHSVILIPLRDNRG